MRGGRKIHVAMIGTRGVPAAYGGFETAVEEIGRRLVASGHEVTVYTRPTRIAEAPREHLGMRLVPLPAVRKKSLETLTHSALSVAHTVSKSRPDMAFVFNAANAAYLPALRSRGIPVATHVDGLEWKRAKWGRIGKRFYRMSETASVKYSDALIADAPGIAAYYRDEYGAETELIAYGAPILRAADASLLPQRITPGAFHLVVARFEPENHVLEIVRGFVASRAAMDLVVVGGAPFAPGYTLSVHEAGRNDRRVRFLGPVWDQRQLDALYFHAHTYLHGHSVGGTNPSLLRAMGSGTATVANDVRFNREVLGAYGLFFGTPAELGRQVELAEGNPIGTGLRGARLRDRAAAEYRWDDVAAQYEDLACRLINGYSRADRKARRRAVEPDSAGTTIDLRDRPVAIGPSVETADARRSA